MTHTAVYRFFDEDGALLYVGMTDNINRRFGSHQSTKDWWPDVVEKTIVWYDTRREAAAAERKALGSERPAYNVRHVPGRKAAKPAGEPSEGEASDWWKYVRSVTSDSPREIARKMSRFVDIGNFTDEELQAELDRRARVRKAS